MILRASALVLLIFAASCGGGGTGPTTFIGFFGSHVISITVGPDSESTTCSGSVQLSSVTGAFNGTLTINPCPPFLDAALSTPITGTVTGQTISFTFIGQSAFIDGIEQEFQCTATRVDPGFQGTLNNDRIQAAITADFTCQDGSGDFSWSIDMQG